MDLPRTYPHIPVFHVPEVRDPMWCVFCLFSMLNHNKNYMRGMNWIIFATLAVFLTECIAETKSYEYTTGAGYHETNRERLSLLFTEQAWTSPVVKSPIFSFLKRRDLSSVNASATQMLDAKTDVFWVFSELIARLGDHFCGDEEGILRRRDQMDALSPFLNMFLLYLFSSWFIYLCF